MQQENATASCDLITRRFFDKERWERALDAGVDKGISKALLREMADPACRIVLYRAITEGRYRISPPHTVKIPKDLRGNYRTVYVNEPADRILLNIANNLLFELMPDKVHPSCKSYISGVGCGRIVVEASRYIGQMTAGDGVIGWKADLSKYFDSVPIEYIDRAFDMVEARHGQSALIKMIRDYYHTDEYILRDGTTGHQYMSLRQGCAVASWLADVLLYHIDERLSQMDGYYVRYCDDMLFTGPAREHAMTVLEEELGQMGLKLNPQKLETVRKDCWFNFLGFAIKGRKISLSESRMVKFQRAIDQKTMKANDLATAVRRVNRFLHAGPDGHSWCTSVLPIINSAQDIAVLNAYAMDAIRAAATGKRRIGGLGFNSAGKDGCIVRGRGRHVAANRLKVPKILDNYRTLMCMKKALLTSRAAFDTLVRQMLIATPRTRLRDEESTFVAESKFRRTTSI